MLVTREFRLELFLAIFQNLEFYGTLNFLLAQKRMGLEISKRYSSYSFHPIWAKLYDKYGGHGEYKVMDILAICQKIKNFCGTLKCYGSQWENLKCGISRKRLMVLR